MQWQGICEFAAVVETGSFTLAGKKLLISTAQVSRQINALEKRLSTKLFYRTTRKVSPTEEGQLFYRQCRNILDGLDEAERSMTNLKGRPQGKINLTAPVTYGERHIIPLISDFLLRYPEVEINVHLSNQRVDLVEEGFDLAIRLGNLDDSTLVAKKISSRQHFLCASPFYVQQHGLPQSIGELKNHNCLLGSSDFWYFSAFDNSAHKDASDENVSDKKSVVGNKASNNNKKVRVTGSLRCNSGLGLVDAALKGLGVVQLPDYYLRKHLEAGELEKLLVAHEPMEEGIWAVYPQNKYLATKVRLLIDFLVDELEGG